MADIAENSTSSRTQNRDKLFTAREYSLKLLIQMHEFHKSKIMCDEFLKVGGRIFAAHRVVLCAASSYFQAMFTGGLAETFDENVEIYGIDADTFAIILDFIYSGYVEVKETNVQQLLPAAKMLQIEEVEKNCCDFLRHELDPSNCVGIYLFADVHACVNLASDALEYIHRNFAEVSKSEEFLQLDKLRLFKLLESEDLKIESEEQVFEAAINWVLSDVKGRRELLGKILEKVRLPLISSTYFDNFLAKCQNASVQRMLEGILENFRKYQMLARGLKIHMQPRKASRKCFYVIGGYSRRVGGRWSDTISLSTVEKFDTFTKKCDSFSTAQMSYPRSGHGVTAVGGMLYAIGGENDSLIYDTTECYNPIENSWSLVAPMLTPRVACGVCVVEDFIYVIGGWVGSEIADDIERYDPQEDKWEVVGKVNTHRFHLGVTELNGLIYAVGGWSELGEELKVCESYNPVSEKWTRLADLNTRRAFLGLATLEGHLYAVGGSNDTKGALSTVERYDTALDAWTQIAALDSPRAGLSVAVNHGHLYAIGGRTASGVYTPPVTMTTIDVYDSKTNQWEHVTDLSFSRCEFGIGIV